MDSPTKSVANMGNLIQRFRRLTENPADFLTRDQPRADAFKTLSKTLFDHVRSYPSNAPPHSAALAELLIGAEFDDEQVWQQLELDNKLNLDSTVKSVASVLVQGEPEFFGFAAGSSRPGAVSPVEKKRHDESGIESQDEDGSEHHFQGTSDLDGDEEDEEDDDDEAFAREEEKEEEEEGEEEEEEEDESVGEEKQPTARPPSGPASVLDDVFFKLSDVNDFLLEDEKQEEKHGAQRGGEEIDYFAEDDDEEDEERIKYDDFFDPPPAKSVAGLQKEAVKSTFEKRQEKLQDRIKQMEEEAVAQKPWQLGGEVSAVKRPENSLLEEFLQFDHVMRQPPVITEEVTQRLEDLILQRIKDKAWDDVQRKARSADVDPYQFKKKLLLDESKAKQSLSQIYEQEYLKKIATTDAGEEKEEHRKIRKAAGELFVKLDALSNFHFVPKPVAPDIKIVNNLPTLVVEEVQPSAVATSQLLAPEEVQPKRRGDLTGATEASATDKNRSRRKKKLLQKVRGLRQKGQEESAAKELKKVEKGRAKGGSSGAFFDKLQDTVRAEQAAKSADGKESKKRKQAVTDSKTVKMFKL